MAGRGEIASDVLTATGRIDVIQSLQIRSTLWIGIGTRPKPVGRSQ